MPPRSRGLASPISLWRSVWIPRVTSRRRFLCLACQDTFRSQKPASRPAYNLPIPSQTFTTSSPFSRKGNKKSGKTSDPETPVPDNKAQANRDAEVDPYDFSELDSGISKALERLKDALSKTRNAGRVSTEMIEALPVELKGGKPNDRLKLADIATVVPKGGRMVQIYAQEEDHIKPLTSALQSSTHSLSPTPDPTNAMILQVPIPPATAETRQLAGQEAKKSLERAMQDIRMARGDAQKQFRKMELQKLVIKDELHKAHKEMEEVVKKGEAEGKKLLDGALKGLER